jgi:hypothetical protein
MLSHWKCIDDEHWLFHRVFAQTPWPIPSAANMVDINSLMFKLRAMGAPRDTWLTINNIPISHESMHYFFCRVFLFNAFNGLWLFVFVSTLVHAKEFLLIILLVVWTEGLYELGQVRALEYMLRTLCY